MPRLDTFNYDAYRVWARGKGSSVHFVESSTSVGKTVFSEISCGNKGEGKNKFKKIYTRSYYCVVEKPFAIHCVSSLR